jgi:asparagine synthase (glutamine-hydrolysing)
MSGIVAILNLDGAPVDRDLLQRMTERMAFRGQDALGTWLEGPSDGRQGYAGLGHALLHTTFEARREKGPCSLDGRVWITADARVDGRADLIRLLRAEGRDPADDAPDPELILHAYHVWGEDCLEHLIGDFCFILWDGPRQRLFCVRDHFGISPFYYAQTGPSLVLSNTLQAVHLHPGVSDELNEQAIGDYLLFRGNQDLTTTTFAHIRRLPPAHTLTWSASGGEPHVRRYWTLPERDGYLRYPHPEDYVDQFRALFRQAVADRLRTDRASVSLSGGMDSSSVAAVAHQVLTAQGRPFDLHAYTFTRTLIPHEEGQYAALVAETLGFPIHYLDADARFQTGPSKEPQALSPEPAFTSAWGFCPRFALWSCAAASGRVLLTGYGGDPSLRPSSSYWINLLKRWQLGQMVADIRRYTHTYGQRPPLYMRANLRRWLGHSPYRISYPAWLNPDFAARLALPTRVEQYARQWRDFEDDHSSMAAEPFWSNLLSNRDPGNTLMPLKVRFPFFDLRLVGYLRAVPPVPWFERKRLLREAMRGNLPQAVLQRPKSPLSGIPFAAFIQQQGVPPWMEDLATTPELAPYVDGDALLGVIRTPTKVNVLEYGGVLHALALAYWLRHQQRKPGPPQSPCASNYTKGGAHRRND